MSKAVQQPAEFDAIAAETRLLEAAVAEARADTLVIPHSEVRAWLLEVANGNFDAPKPVR